MTAASLSYAQMYDAARALYLARRNHIEQAKRGDFKRPPEWFTEQAHVLDEIAAMGAELRLIAAHAASYDAWKATLPKGVAA